MSYDWGNKTPAKGYNVFSVSDEVVFNRVGKKIYAKGKDGSFVESDTVEANLLFEMLKVLKKK